MPRNPHGHGGPARSTALASLKRRAWFLRSRVARRIFGLFLGCALLPLLLFAGLSLRKVSNELSTHANTRLHAECKSFGMSIVERILSMRDILALSFPDDEAGTAERIADLPSTLRERLDARFAWLAVGSPESVVLDSSEAGVTLPPLTPDALQLLERTRTAITFTTGPEGAAEIVLVAALPSGPGDRLVFAAVRGDYLWSVDGFILPDTELMALTDSGEFLFTTVPGDAFRDEVTQALSRDRANGQLTWRADGAGHLASYRTMFTRPQIGRNFVIAQSQPLAEVLAPMAAFRRIFILLASLSLLGIVLASMIQIRRNLVPIEVLKAATARIHEHDLSARVEIRSGDEFQDLGDSFNGMAAGLERYVGTLDSLHRIGVALTAERDSDRLLEIVATASLEVTGGSLVLLHLAAPDGSRQVVHAEGRTDRAADVEAHERALVALCGAPAEAWSGLVERALADDSSTWFSRSGPETGDLPYARLESECGVEVAAAVCAPMRDHEGQVIGALEVLSTSRGAAFSGQDVQVIESLASQAAVALTKNRLVDDFQNLFEALSELLATAIDEKSKYTGEHCRRVPLLTMMLADEVCSTSDGTFSDFAFTEEELYELKVAALLHDCGKVVTPVHVVDKATKLETITDRIELVATRFEVARRDLEVARLYEALDTAGVGADQRARIEADVAAAAVALEDDLEFIRRANVGHEFMHDDAVARVEEIARRRTWNDPRGERAPLLTDDEVENLCVRRGTLTADEREVINYHVVATIKMLEMLPYPERLRRVPEIAGAHHERMDGKGYPLGLDRSQITLQGRILGLADVVEALTAKDRPYKPGRTLSETLRILGEMTRDGHIDPDLFQLFIDSGTYRRYAEEFLDPEQVDEVDLDSIPSYTPGGGARRAA